MSLKKYCTILLLLALASCSTLTHTDVLAPQTQKQLKLYNNAPLQVVAVSHVSLPKAQAFELVSKNIHEWFPGVEKFSWDHSNSDHAENFGSGSVRTGLYNGDTMVETVRVWQPSQYYIYQIDLEHSKAFMPIQNHTGIFIVKDDGAGGSIITWKQYFDSKVPFLAGITAWVMQNFIIADAFENLSSKFQ